MKTETINSMFEVCQDRKKNPIFLIVQNKYDRLSSMERWSFCF